MDLGQIAADLEATDSAVRLRAAEQLAKDPPQARGLAMALAKAAADEDELVSEAAAGVLEDMGPPEASDCPALSLLAASAESDTAYWACTLLGRAGKAAAGVAAALASVATQHADQSVRERACWALGKLGSQDAAVLTALREAASQSGRLARVAHEALGELGAL